MIPYHTFAHLLSEIITGLLAYIITISPIGYFRAWVAKKMGDYGPEEQGFLTFNPFAHISIIGILLIFSLSTSLRSFNVTTGPLTEFIFFGLLVFICVAAGIQTIRLPIFDLSNYYEPYRKLKIFIASFSGFFAYLFLGIGALIALCLIAGKAVLNNSASFSAVMVILTGIHMCAIFAMFDLFIYGTYLFLYQISDDRGIDLQSQSFLISFIALILIMFFGDTIRQGIALAAHGILSLM